MTENDRQQRMAERILEDESLRGDLEDDAATVLVDWASKRAAAAAADPALPDDVVEEQVQAIRQAARAAARSGQSDPRQLIAVAEARLAPGVTLSSDAAVDTPSAATVGVTKPAEQSVASAGQLAQSTAAVPSVGEERAATVAASEHSQPATTAPQIGNTPLDSGSSSQPAGSADARPRRKRSRLARFLKRVLGER